MYMKLKDGKSKVVTLSYDDGVVQDIRLIEIMNKYGLKGTFNINTGLYSPEELQREKFYGRLKLSEAKELYTNSGHEIAVHGLKHQFLERLRPEEVLGEILEDRKNLEKEYGIIARGMAYPFGTYSGEVVDCLKKCGIVYARTTKSTEDFKFPSDWLQLHPTCHHKNSKLMRLAKHFVEDEIRSEADTRMFYLWGHSYEFDNDNNWHVIEEFADYVGGRSDTWYATNIEIYDYVMAYKNLHVSVDQSIIYNPSAIDVWFVKDGNTYCVGAGKTLVIK